jgi:hypothetical protein
MAKLTKSVIEEIQPEERDAFLCDDTPSGFGIRVLPSGKRSWCALVVPDSNYWTSLPLAMPFVVHTPWV